MAEPREDFLELVRLRDKMRQELEVHNAKVDHAVARGWNKVEVGEEEDRRWIQLGYEEEDLLAELNRLERAVDRVQRATAFAMGLHERLGCASQMQGLPGDLALQICKRALEGYSRG